MTTAPSMPAAPDPPTVADPPGGDPSAADRPGDLLVVAGTLPYPWPFDGLRAADLALVLAGWDAHWAARPGNPDDGAAAGAAVASLARAVRRLGAPVVAIAHTRPLRAPAGTPDPTPLADPRADLAVVAAGLDGFYGSHLEHRLRAAGRTQLLVAGHGLEGPVHSTLRAANDRGFECLLVLDACSSLDADLATAASSSVQMSGGIFGAVGRTADVLTAVTALAALAPEAPAVPPPSNPEVPS